MAATIPFAVGGEGRALFRSIMRLHRTKLPVQMRALGDPYVRKEFKLHYEPQVKPSHRVMFIKQWNDYVDTLSLQATVVGQDMSEEQQSKLNDEQKKQMVDLEKHARSL